MLAKVVVRDFKVKRVLRVATGLLEKAELQHNGVSVETFPLLATSATSSQQGVKGAGMVDKVAKAAQVTLAQPDFLEEVRVTSLSTFHLTRAGSFPY